MSDLDQLREIGQLLRRPDFEEILGTRRGRARQARVVAAAGLAVSTAAVVVVLAVTGSSIRGDRPPIAPSPTPTPTERLETPAGQETLRPEVDPGDVRGFEVLATVTNSAPETRNDSALSATVPDTRGPVSTYCRGAPDLFYFLDIGDGGGQFGPCSPGADTSLAPNADIGDLVVRDPLGNPQTVTMWIGRPSAAWLRCRRDGSAECSLSDVPPTSDPDAEFGFRVFAHEPTLAIQLLDDAGNGAPYPVAALSTVGGTVWLLEQAVVAAPDADRLAFELPASDRAQLVDVYTGVSRHLERCRAQHADELPDRVSTDHLVYEAAFDEVCGVDVRLVVDGATVVPVRNPRADGHFRALGAELSPGAAHRIVVQVVRGDPRDVRYAVVVRTHTQLS